MSPTRHATRAIVFTSLATVVAANPKTCQMYLVSGKFKVSRNHSLFYNETEVWYYQNDQFYPWFYDESIVFIKWITDQTNGKKVHTEACQNILYTARNTEICLKPVDSKSTMILFGGSRTKQLFLSIDAVLNHEIKAFDENNRFLLSPIEALIHDWDLQKEFLIKES